MTPIAVAAVVFVCVSGGTLLGMFLRGALPADHLSDETRDVVKLGMGLVATMAALVLGLVIASAKSSYDAQDQATKHAAAYILLLDRVLAHYGPETKEIRAVLRSVVVLRLESTWPEDGSESGGLDVPGTTPTVEGIETRVRELAPRGGAQDYLRSRALEITGDLMETRWIMLGGAGTAVPLPFLVVVVFWLAVIFASFGLLAPRNPTVFAVLLICALSVASAIFLILEMDHPFEGFMKVSSAPVRYTLEHLGE